MSVELAAGVEVDPDIAKVSLVGAGMKSHPGIAAKVFRTLADAGINIEMISTSTIRVSVVVADSDVEQAVRVVHDAFNLSGDAATAEQGAAHEADLADVQRQ